MSIVSKVLSHFGYEKSATVDFMIKESAPVDYSFAFDYGIPFKAEKNFIALYESVPEVAFPINYISERIAGGNYQLKYDDDDSVIWENEEINKLLSNPNSIFNFNEFIKSFYSYYLLLGNSYIKASISDTFAEKEIWRWCDNYISIPNGTIRSRKFHLP